MNVLLTQYLEISVLKGRERPRKEEGEETEGEVSYLVCTVSSDLQVT